MTIDQPDKSFAKNWPDAHCTQTGSCGGSGAWVTKLRRRLKAPRSRVRERRADFLMFQVVDLCTDDLVQVTQAFLSRLRFLEEVLQNEGAFAASGWVREVSRINLQLCVVSRRLRGLQRILRKWKEDADLSVGLVGYLQDVLDHVDEAFDDTSHLTEKCDLLTAAYVRAVDSSEKLANQQRHERTNLQEDRMNSTLFVLTLATFIFAPMQFIAGVYGMNFVDGDGNPSIPELVSPQGYKCFWAGVSCYFLLSTALASYGWRRMMGSIDDDLYRKFAHLHDTVDQPKTPVPKRRMSGMINPLKIVDSSLDYQYASDGYIKVPNSIDSLHMAVTPQISQESADLDRDMPRAWGSSSGEQNQASDGEHLLIGCNGP